MKPGRSLRPSPRHEHDIGLDRVGAMTVMRKAEKGLDSGHSLNVEPAGFADGLDAGGRETGVKDGPQGFLPKCWKHGVPRWKHGVPMSGEGKGETLEKQTREARCGQDFSWDVSHFQIPITHTRDSELAVGYQSLEVSRKVVAADNSLRVSSLQMRLISQEAG